MKIYGVEMTTKELFISGIASAILFYVSKEILLAVDPDLENKLDITHKDNFVNSVFTNIYQGVTGSTQMPGEDMFDFMHPDISDNIKKGTTLNPDSPAANVLDWFDHVFSRDENYESVDPVYNLYDYEQMGA